MQATSIGAENTLFPVGTIGICHLNTDVTHNKVKAVNHAISHRCYRCNLVTPPDDPFQNERFHRSRLVALAVGLMQGMPLDKVIGSIKAGVGGTLGSLALIMGFGAMLGKMLADCGGAQRIATTLIAKFGKNIFNGRWY